jgi:hypothetical protein
MTLVRPWFFGGSVLLIFLVFCVVFYGLIVLCLVSCVPNVASLSGLSIFDLPFGFL